MYWIIASTIMVGFLYYSDGVNVIKYNVGEKYRRFRVLNKIVGGKQKSGYKVFLTSTYIVTCMLWRSFIQRVIKTVDRSVEPLGNNRYLITCMLGGRKCSLIVKQQRGPPDVSLIVNGNGDDVTDKIMPSLQIVEVQHNKSMTSEDFGEGTLSFELIDGRTVRFSDNEPFNY